MYAVGSQDNGYSLEVKVPGRGAWGFGSALIRVLVIPMYSVFENFSKYTLICTFLYNYYSSSIKSLTKQNIKGK